MDDGAISLRDTLSQAFDADEAANTPVIEAPVIEAPALVEKAPAESAGQQVGQPAEGVTARDENGRFAKSTDLVQNEISGAEPASPTILPPNTWKATAKSKFASLDPDIQAEVLRREREIEDGKAQWDSKANQYNRLTALIDPHREKWALRGVSEDQAIQQLLAASDFLERDPRQALQYLAGQYGVNLSQFAQPAQQQVQGQAQFAPQQYAQQFQEPQLPPALQPFLQEFQDLKQQVLGQQRETTEREQAKISSDIEAFSKDRIYFHNVVDRMAAFIESGQAQGADPRARMESAYDMACWADPEIRPLLMAEQAKKAELSAKVEKAKAAAVSVTGSPGGAGALNGAQPASTREALLQSWDEIEGRA